MAEPDSPTAAEDLRLLDPDGRFCQRLAADREALRAERARTDELAVIAHRLAGAAGTFGHPEIGDAAMALEGALERAEPQAKLAAALARLLQTLDAALA